MKKMYLATGYLNRNSFTYKRVFSALQEDGWGFTFDWASTETDSKDAELGHGYFKAVAEREAHAVSNCQVLGVVLPGGRGTHVELGMALAYEKPVVIFAPNPEDLLGGEEYQCMFYRLPAVHVVTSLEDFIKTANFLMTIFHNYDHETIEDDS